MVEPYPRLDPCRLEFKVVYRHRSLQDSSIPNHEDNDPVLPRDAVLRCV